MAIAHKRFALTIVVCAGLLSASVRSASLSPRQGSGQAGERTAQAPTFGIGHTPAPARLKRIDIDVTPDGAGLLPRSGTAAKGKDVFTRRCETCHGPTGTEGPQDTLAGGKGSLATAKPLKTVGSYWPYATTLWD